MIKVSQTLAHHTLAALIEGIPDSDSEQTGIEDADIDEDVQGVTTDPETKKRRVGFFITIFYAFLCCGRDY
jgi:hypothetical protein